MQAEHGLSWRQPRQCRASRGGRPGSAASTAPPRQQAPPAVLERQVLPHRPDGRPTELPLAALQSGRQPHSSLPAKGGQLGAARLPNLGHVPLQVLNSALRGGAALVRHIGVLLGGAGCLVCSTERGLLASHLRRVAKAGRDWQQARPGEQRFGSRCGMRTALRRHCAACLLSAGIICLLGRIEIPLVGSQLQREGVRSKELTPGCSAKCKGCEAGGGVARAGSSSTQSDDD